MKVLEIGDKVKYKVLRTGEINTSLVTSELFGEDLEDTRFFQILEIERIEYKPIMKVEFKYGTLLTDEEKCFLRNYVNIIKYDLKYMLRSDNLLCLYNDIKGDIRVIEINTECFKGLKDGEKYNISELRFRY